MRPFPTLLALAAVATTGVILARPASRPAAGAGMLRAPLAPPAGFHGVPASTTLSAALALQEPLALVPDPREFFFTRAVYSSWRGYGRRGASWATDYPKADRQFVVVLKRLTNLDAYDYENAVRLDDPDLRRFPFLYALEVGYMDLSEAEVRGLRDYLNAGGFLVIDDFWGMQEWDNFEYQIARVLPGREIVDLPLDHPLFSTFYDITEVRQTPAIGRGVNGWPTWERPDAKVPMVKGIFDDKGRLMVVINWNTDLGDAWEHAENPFYPLEYSTYAYQVGVNMVVYGMSH